jgi:hypothetical protein
MKISGLRTVGVLLGAGAALTFLVAQADSPFAVMRNFSARQTVVANGRTISGKIYRSGDKLRNEMSMGKMTMYHLTMIDTGDTYMVMPQNNMCMKMHTDVSKMNPAMVSGSKDAKLTRTTIGAETVDGHPCKIEHVVGTSGNASVDYKVWEAQDLKGFPVKIVMSTPKGDVTTTYSDINLSTPDASLFTPPTNCRTMGSMGMPH